MTERRLLEFLQDILDAIAEIESFTDSLDFQAFLANREKILAVVKLLEIVGEAVKKIPDEQRVNYPEISWKSVAGMRDILVHTYWNIDPVIVWATIQESLPPVKMAISQMLSQAETNP
jgi:uncharacterized protein with HEPN domain